MKDIDTLVLKTHDVSPLWKHNIEHQIDLGWIDPSTFQKLCSPFNWSCPNVSSPTTKYTMM